MSRSIGDNVIHLGAYRTAPVPQAPTSRQYATQLPHIDLKPSNLLFRDRMAGELKMSSVQKREFPDHLYVAVPTIVRKVSEVVLVVCLFSLAVTALSGFRIIHPFAAIIIAAASVMFFIMGRVLKRTPE